MDSQSNSSEKFEPITAFIPMRAGSKGIKHKNTISLNGRPLCHWIFDAVRESNCFERLVVSTDCSEVKEACNSYPFDIVCLERPSLLAGDTSKADDTLIFHLNSQSDHVWFEDYIMFLQATSPCVRGMHLALAIEKFFEDDLDSLFAAGRIHQFLWTNDCRPMNYDPAKRPNRQQHSGQLYESGGFYLFRRSGFLQHRSRLFGNIGCFEMPEHANFEIDEPLDLVVAEALLKTQ